MNTAADIMDGTMVAQANMVVPTHRTRYGRSYLRSAQTAAMMRNGASSRMYCGVEGTMKRIATLRKNSLRNLGSESGPL